MDDAEFDRLVNAVAERLESNSISRLIPREIAAWLREATFGYAQQYQFVMPLAGGNAMRIEMKVNIDGSIEMRLADTKGAYFWSAELREMKGE